MEIFGTLLQSSGFAHLHWTNLVMYVIGGVLIYLAITKEFEPLL
ncbi:MAG: glutaconyl-CoA decarboxylase subunit beta, partial [Calditrichaeota bacterium]|nr:glutaconyl-CoA decarboxylase subunit beta [Calditrichota bacterium]